MRCRDLFGSGRRSLLSSRGGKGSSRWCSPCRPVGSLVRTACSPQLDRLPPCARAVSCAVPGRAAPAHSPRLQLHRCFLPSRTEPRRCSHRPLPTPKLLKKTFGSGSEESQRPAFPLLAVLSSSAPRGSSLSGGKVWGKGSWQEALLRLAGEGLHGPDPRVLCPAAAGPGKGR